MLAPSISSPAAHSDLLQSWKEISNYLHRGIRTVQRWEGMGLPVRRLGTGAKAPVIADARDLDRWLQGAQLHGFGSAQPAAHLIARGLLCESLQQARQLRQEMGVLRASHGQALVRLVSGIANVAQSCLRSHSDGEQNNSQSRC